MYIFDRAFELDATLSPATSIGLHPKKRTVLQSDTPDSPESIDSVSSSSDGFQPNTAIGFQPPPKKRRTLSTNIVGIRQAGKRGRQISSLSERRCSPQTVSTISVGDRCIPLWPQYKLPDSDASFIKMAIHEDWVVALTHAVRDRYVAAQKEQGRESSLPHARVLAMKVSNTISHGVKTEVKFARNEHSRASRDKFPAFVDGASGTLC